MGSVFEVNGHGLLRCERAVDLATAAKLARVSLFEQRAGTDWSDANSF